MLDETLPPGGDDEPAAPEPAHETAGPVAPADAGEPAAPGPDAETAAWPAAETVDAPAADANVETEAEPASAMARDAAVMPPSGQSAGAATAPAPTPEMSPAACAALLAERFPGLFAAGRALPIKLRVQVDIQARAPGVFARKGMSLFLHRYTTSTAYLKALVSSPHRFDLDGAAAGEVAAEHREAAQIELQRRQAIVQEKRSAQRRMDRPARPGPGPRDDARAGAQTAPDAAAAAGLQPGAQAATPSAGQGERPRGPGNATRPRQPQQQWPRRDDWRPPVQAGLVAAGPQGPGSGRMEGPRREQRSPRPPRPPEAPRQPMQPRRETGDAGAGPQARADFQPPRPSLPPAEIEARRERAALLRAYESSTLTKANFCVLKRVSEADLDSALTQARQERGENMPRPGR